MTRVLAAALSLSVASAPAFACEWQKSANTDTAKRTIASQPANGHSSAVPTATAASQKRS